MSADRIIYCLEQLTDYAQFERFCSDVMHGVGYRDIEPLGGTNDGGRDALHVSRSKPEEVTIFAYSVRSDWRQKLLNEDCERIKAEGHPCKNIVFLCTSGITATQRDAAIADVRTRFGWNLELYGLDRLRVLLIGELRYILAAHPAIFCPPFFPTAGGIPVTGARDTIVIDHVPSDHALAAWLSRRLQIAGHRVWCAGTAPLAGESADETIRLLIEARAARYLPLFSKASSENSDFLARCTTASSVEKLLVPCYVESFETTKLPSRMRTLVAVQFKDGWAAGLQSILCALDSAGIRSAMDTAQGAAIAIRSYMPEPVTKPGPETVYSNSFPTALPAAIQAWDLSRSLSKDEEKDIRRSWAFVEAADRMLLSFDSPPRAVPTCSARPLSETSWKSCQQVHGKRSRDVVHELVRRSMDVVCVRAGLEWCDKREIFYFRQEADDARNRNRYTHVDGRKTNVSLTGEKQHGFGIRAKRFRYQLSPGFRAGLDEDNQCFVTLRIYVRVTELDGQPILGPRINTLRKNVAKNWWNKEWFDRTIGIMQALAEGGEEIIVGDGEHRVIVACKPLTWDSPVALDYLAVERIGDFQAELAALANIPESEELPEAQAELERA